MRKWQLFVEILALWAGVVPRPLQAQTERGPLDSLAALKPNNVKALPVTYRGRKALRVGDAASADTDAEQRLVVLPGIDFQDGIIEVGLAGDRRARASMSRGQSNRRSSSMI